MNRMSREEFERQAVLYAMGALSPEEARTFEVERTRRGSEGESLARGVGRAIGPPVTPSERASLAAVTAVPARHAPWGWIALCVALLAVATAAGVWALAERSRSGALERRVERLGASADSLGQALEQSRETLAAQPRAAELAPLLGAPDLAVVPLAGPQGAQGGLLAAPGRGALLVATGLPVLPEGDTYQLWRRTGDLTEPIAALGNATSGFLFALFTDAGFLAGAETVLVSGESLPVGSLPTQDAVLEGRVPWSMRR